MAPPQPILQTIPFTFKANLVFATFGLAGDFSLTFLSMVALLQAAKNNKLNSK
jgi:hypothetical protein